MRQYCNILIRAASKNVLPFLAAVILLSVVGCGGNPMTSSSTQPPPVTPPPVTPPPVKPPPVKPPPVKPPPLVGTNPLVETCKNAGNILPAGGQDSSGQYEDLQISDGTQCVVDGSAPGANYVYRNVNIWGRRQPHVQRRQDQFPCSLHPHREWWLNDSRLWQTACRGRCPYGSMAPEAPTAIRLTPSQALRVRAVPRAVSPHPSGRPILMSRP